MVRTRTIGGPTMKAGSFSLDPHKAAAAASWLRFDDEKRQIPWVISSEVRDHEGDVVSQKGIDLSLFKSNPQMLWGHDHSLPSIGSWPKVGKNMDIGGVRMTAALAQFATREEHELADTLYMLARPVGPDGKKRVAPLRASSIGFLSENPVYPKDQTEREKLGLGPGGVLHRKSILIETSIVNVGMNPQAIQLGLKGFVDAGMLPDSAIERFLERVPLSREDWEKRCKASLRSSVQVPDMSAIETREIEIPEPEEIEPAMTVEEAKRLLEAEGYAVSAGITPETEEDEPAPPFTGSGCSAHLREVVEGNTAALCDLSTALGRLASEVRGLQEHRTGGDVRGREPDADPPDAGKDVAKQVREALEAALARVQNEKAD